MLRSKLLAAALSSAMVAGVAAAQQEVQTEEQLPAQQQGIEIERAEGEQGQHLQKKMDEFGPMTSENVLNKLYQTSVKEIALGQLAADKGSSSRVRDFGERLVEDHKAAAKRVKEVARAENVQIHQLSDDDDEWNPADEDEALEDDTALDIEEQARVEVKGEAYADQKEQTKMAKEKFRADYQKLHALEDEAFDEQFLAMMDQEHEMLIQKLQEVEQQVEDEEVKQLIAQTRPILSEHHEMAQLIQSELETAQRPTQPGQTQQN